MARERSRGFALIELVVVAALVALLAGLVLPRLSSAVVGAKASACRQNMSVAVAGLETYRIERGRFPSTGGEDKGLDELGLASYVGREAIRCPDAGDYYTWNDQEKALKCSRHRIGLRFDDDSHRWVFFQLAGPPPAQPSVVTEEATDVGEDSATLNMSYDFRDYGSGQLQFKWRISGGSWNYTSWVSGSGSGTYSLELTGLSSNTTYEFAARLKYDSTEIEGEVRSFTTAKVAPTVATEDASNVGTNSATLNMSYDFKDYGSGQVQFAYRPSWSGGYTYTSWVNKSGSGTYAEKVAPLIPGTTYYFKARLKYGFTEIEGAELSFTTLDLDPRPPGPPEPPGPPTW